MFELDHDLAQDIVDRTMAILPYNVNVMDSQGLILGSGEPERINTRHEGAQLVLANGRVVEIDAQTAKHLKGVQPGINLPLLHDQRLIGVLGITGEPELLRTYAALVQMTAEMLVGQRHQQAEQQWRRQRCDDLLALLLSDEGGSPRLADEAQQMGLKPQLARTPYLFELGLEHGVGQTAEALSAWLISRYPDSWCVSSAQTSLLWCRPATLTVDNQRLLVATTVIEVGVDVPNASLMIIENPERFGLSQLHQLRGRVGRGAAASACVLLYAVGDNGKLGETAKERLRAMAETNDGFEIARRDLEIRGPGEFLGARQSGAAMLRFADLATDTDFAEVGHGRVCRADAWALIG